MWEGIDSPGGHIAVALLILLLGVVLALFGHADVGVPLLTGASTSIYTSMRGAGKAR